MSKPIKPLFHKSQRRARNNEGDLYFDIGNYQLPIIYSPKYNIGFLGLEKVHPFDSKKWGRVFEFLKAAKMVTDESIVTPNKPSLQDLLVVHSQAYLDSLLWSINVARITEVPFVAIMPNFLVQKKLLEPFQYHTGGTILAGKIALEKGWCINIGGGFHHCSANSGGGFCAYADITLTIMFLFNRIESVSRAMIVDLDAHQGNGHERDFRGDKRVFIMDVYNASIYPGDTYAKNSISRQVELDSHTGDDEYLEKVNSNLEASLQKFAPDILIYNAGTDILIGDPLGRLDITPQGVITRDEIVFTKAREWQVPIVMVTSGGYQRSTAQVIAESILNLERKGLIYGVNSQQLPHDLSNPSTSSRY